MYAPDRTRRHHGRRAGAARGLTMVELMVSIVIALLVSLTAAGGAMVFTSSQRQGVAVGGATVSSGTALAALRDEIAAAGLGFFGNANFLCSRLNLSVDTTVVLNGATFSPVNITAEGTNSRVDVVYGTEVMSGTNVLLNGTATLASAPLRSLLPVAVGQAVLLAPAAAGDPCVVRTITANNPAVLDTPQSVEFSNVTTARYNRAVFTTNTTYPDQARITLLGDLRWTRFRLDGTNLLMQRPLGGADVILARNVVAFRAEYGLADAGTTALASWQAASGASWAAMTPANLPRLRALRIGVVTRSMQPEKPNTAGNCEATTAMPTLFDVAVVSDVDDWQCYRYRSSIVVVPLRNLVLGVAA